MLTRIAQVADLLGESTSTLRFWQDSLGIPVLRTKGGQRWYAPRSINRLRLAKRLIREEGYTLEGAKARLRQLEEW